MRKLTFQIPEEFFFFLMSLAAQEELVLLEIRRYGNKRFKMAGGIAWRGPGHGSEGKAHREGLLSVLLSHSPTQTELNHTELRGGRVGI